MNDVEDLLRSELSAMADALESGSVPAHAVLQHGRRARRRRQAVAVGAGAVLTAAAVAVVAGLGPRPVVQDPVVPATSAPPVPYEPVWTWAQGLPVADVPPEPGDAPAGAVRWRGELRALPAPPEGLGDVARAVGAVGDDLLVEWNTDGFTGADDYEARIGRLSPDGTWRPLGIDDTDTLDVSGAAVDPDQGLYAYSGETLTREGPTAVVVLRRVPDDSVVTIEVVERGTTVRGWIGGRLAVTTAEGSLRLLDGDSFLTIPEAAPVGVEPVAVGRDAVEVAGPSDRCAQGSTEHTMVVFEGTAVVGKRLLGCAPADAPFLSPDGTHVVTTREPFTILVVPDGRPVSTEGPALTDGLLPPVVRWEEDGRHVVVSYPVDLARYDRPTLFRCAVADGSCTRDQ